jgi:hypothetical protein
MYWDGLADLGSVLDRLTQMSVTRKDWKVRAFVRDPAGRTFQLQLATRCRKDAC